MTKLLLDETVSHQALALAEAAPSWPLTHGDSPAAAGAQRLREIVMEIKGVTFTGLLLPAWEVQYCINKNHYGYDSSVVPGK